MRVMVSQAKSCNGLDCRPLGLRFLRLRVKGFGRPRESRRCGIKRILSGCRAMMRAMVETLGSGRRCCWHQGCSRTWSLALPRLGYCCRSARIFRTRCGARLSAAFRGARFGYQYGPGYRGLALVRVASGRGLCGLRQRHLVRRLCRVMRHCAGLDAVLGMFTVHLRNMPKSGYSVKPFDR